MELGNEADKDARQSYRLFRVRRTLLKMLQNRRFRVPQSEIDLSHDEFKQRWGYPTERAKLLTLVQSIDDANEKLIVFFPENKVDVKGLGSIAEQCNNQEVRRAILVVETDLSPVAKKAILQAQPEYMFEVFKESELLVDITEHELVPKHEVLTPDEKKQLMIRYKLKDSQLPRMFTTDPITRYFGLQRGDVVKIIRSSETAGRYVTYRIVF